MAYRVFKFMQRALKMVVFKKIILSLQKKESSI